jgi:hypothetical protein
MNKLRLDVVIVVACALLLLLLGYERGAMGPPRPSVFSTYDGGPNGCRALYEVLRASGLPVGRFERAVSTLDSSTHTLIVTGYEEDPSAKPLDAHDAEFLRRWVGGGGRLVVFDAEFAGKGDVTPGVGTSRRAAGGAAVALARNAYTAGVSRFRGPIGWAFPFQEPRGIPLLAGASGPVAVWYRYGRGEVIAVTAPAIFGNAQLRNADNLRFAYNAIAGRGDAAFDEYVHGYDDGLTMWAVLPGPVRAAIWIVLALAAIALIGANVPFAPPYLPDPPDERDSSYYIAALAELMRRSRRRAPDDDVLWQAIVDWQRRKEHA